MAFILWPENTHGEAVYSPVVVEVSQKASLPTNEVKAPQIAKSALWRGNSNSVEVRIREIAAEIGLKNVERALAIARCESGLNPAAVGDHGWSHGIWQIYLKAHPTITKEQAHDVNWSTRWALEKMKQGSWSLWSCNKLI